MQTYKNRGYKEVAERVLWTAAQAGIGFLIVESANWDYEWVPVLTTILAVLKNVAAVQLTGTSTVPESADDQ